MQFEQCSHCSADVYNKCISFPLLSVVIFCVMDSDDVAQSDSGDNAELNLLEEQDEGQLASGESSVTDNGKQCLMFSISPPQVTPVMMMLLKMSVYRKARMLHWCKCRML